MNYDTYKLLNQEQKEEYNFLFGDKPELKFSVLLVYMALQEMIIFMMVAVLAIKIPEFGEMRAIMQSIIPMNIMMWVAFISIMALNSLYFLGNALFYEIRLNAWLKKNGVKRVYKIYKILEKVRRAIKK